MTSSYLQRDDSADQLRRTRQELIQMEGLINSIKNRTSNNISIALAEIVEQQKDVAREELNYRLKDINKLKKLQLESQSDIWRERNRLADLIQEEELEKLNILERAQIASQKTVAEKQKSIAETQYNTFVQQLNRREIAEKESALSIAEFKKEQEEQITNLIINNEINSNLKFFKQSLQVEITKTQNDLTSKLTELKKATAKNSTTETVKVATNKTQEVEKEIQQQVNTGKYIDKKTKKVVNLKDGYSIDEATGQVRTKTGKAAQKNGEAFIVEPEIITQTVKAKVIEPVFEEMTAAQATAMLAAKNAIIDLQIEVEEKQTEINKWAQLQNSDTLKEYTSLLAQSKLLEDQLHRNQEIATKLAEAGVDPDSFAGKLIKNDINAQSAKEQNSNFINEIKNGSILSGIIKIFNGKSVGPDGQIFTKQSANKKFNKAYEESTYTSKKEFKKDVNKQLASAKKKKNANGESTWNAYLKAKNDLASDQDNEELKQAFKDALAETGMSENQAEAAEAQEQSKQTTVQGWANAVAVLANIAEQIDSLIDTVASNKSAVDTRLYGSKQNEKDVFGSYWNKLSYDIANLMLSPVIKAEDLTNNLLSAINRGISRDVEQVAMLETIKDKIATTFDTFDSTLLRLIKIQDENTTAARLGMEASLNELLNEMYETTEYLSNLAASVRSSLEEAESLMNAADAVEFEYEVQKWLGSLSSVGFSSSSITSIATSLGQLASGDIEGITNGSTGNLIVMAANAANKSISDILTNGLSADETNELLSEMVTYMQELAKDSENNLVVQQQLAKVYGLTASDLKAATNLAGTYLDQTGFMEALTNTTETYESLYANLFDMADSMISRTSIGEILSNVWDNLQYTTALTEASNPVLYITNKIADILDSFAGGIAIPAVTAFGTGVDTKLTVSNILKSASMVTAVTENLVGLLGSALSSGGEQGIGAGSGLLTMVGLKSTVKRGTTTSQSGETVVYNGDVNDTISSAESEGEDEASAKTVEAKEESTEVTNETINESILSIYTLLEDVVNGNNNLSVRVENFNEMPDTSSSLFSFNTSFGG